MVKDTINKVEKMINLKLIFVTYMKKSTRAKYMNKRNAHGQFNIWKNTKSHLYSRKCK